MSAVNILSISACRKYHSHFYWKKRQDFIEAKRVQYSSSLSLH